MSTSIKLLGSTSSNGQVVLGAATAADLMRTVVTTVRAHDSIKQAAATLLDRRVHGAAVLDRAGKPVGVLALSDLVAYERDHVTAFIPDLDFYQRGELELPGGKELPSGFHLEDNSQTVADIMTPMILAVRKDCSAHEIVKCMLEERVHRMFVVDEADQVIGVVGTFDLLHALQPQD